MTSEQAALQRLRAAGHKITGARRAVLEALVEAGGHLTSSEVLERVEVRAPGTGRASVFRTLELLTSLSIIRPTFVESRSPSYVLMSADGHHSHIICTSCSRTIELEDCHVNELAADLEQRYGVALTGHLLEFYGLCAECRSAGRA